MNNKAVKFFSKLFESRQMAHIFHLTVKSKLGSGWEHSALNEYYDTVLEKTDDLIETFQGQYGIVEGYEMIDTSSSRTEDVIEYFTGLAKFIQNERFSAIPKEDTHLHNIVDEILALTYKTIYKLSNLK